MCIQPIFDFVCFWVDVILEQKTFTEKVIAVQAPPRNKKESTISTSRKMELNITFFAGLGCGVCLGLSLFAFRRFLRPSPETKEAMKRFTSNSEYKMVMVVRTDLNMSKGKIAAQCGHAAVGAFEKAQRKDPISLEIWKSTGQAKIAVKTDSLEELKHIADSAIQMGLITSMIRDAGRTQIAPNSITVLGVGPAPKEVMDQLTGHLKLL